MSNISLCRNCGGILDSEDSDPHYCHKNQPIIMTENARLHAEISALREKLKVAEEALEFYGFELVPHSLNAGQAEITTATGKRAREALARIRSGET